jgi:hypothetical protein
VDPADWRGHDEQVVAGARSRRVALGGVVIAPGTVKRVNDARDYAVIITGGRR